MACSPRVAVVVALGAVLACSPAVAGSGLPGAVLTEVELAPAPGARLPLAAQWRDENGVSLTLAQAMAGHPALLIFADYTCQTLCGPVLSAVSDALVAARLDASDYRLIVLGLDPKDGPVEAAVMKRNVVADAVTPATTLLTADTETVRDAEAAVGYRARYDSVNDQFAHPAAALALAPDGRVTRVLSSLGLNADDLRLALVEAGQGRIGSLGDRLRLLCYGFDPSVGIYTLSIYRALAAATAVTVIALAAAIAWMAMRSRAMTQPPRAEDTGLPDASKS